MSISSMGVRSSLRRAQDLHNAEPAVVVSALQPAGEDGKLTASPKDSGSPVAAYLERLTAWIPTESIALFIGFAGFSRYSAIRPRSSFSLESSQR